MKQVKNPLRSLVTAALIGVLALAAPASAFARDDNHAAAHSGDAQEGRGRARDNVFAQYVPLESIIGQIQARTPGRLVGVRGPNGGLYQIIWETPDGRVMTFVVDARTGQILR